MVTLNIDPNIFGSQTKTNEIILLLKDKKPVVRQGFYDSEFKKVKEFCEKNNLFLVKSKFKVLLDNQNYSNKGIRVKEDHPQGMYFVYISKNEEQAWLTSYYELIQDHNQLGLILGYPECCVDFFCQNFNQKKTNLELTPTNPWTNLSKRTKDCVLLSHFPCKSDCEASINLAKKYFSVLQENNTGDTKKLIRNLENY